MNFGFFQPSVGVCEKHWESSVIIEPPRCKHTKHCLDSTLSFRFIFRFMFIFGAGKETFEEDFFGFQRLLTGIFRLGLQIFHANLWLWVRKSSTSRAQHDARTSFRLGHNSGANINEFFIAEISIPLWTAIWSRVNVIAMLPFKEDRWLICENWFVEIFCASKMSKTPEKWRKELETVDVTFS